jgi:hypothetical protein
MFDALYLTQGSGDVVILVDEQRSNVGDINKVMVPNMGARGSVVG